MTTTIHIDGRDLIARLDEHGWTQRAWTDEATGAICAHQAIRLCSPQPGDAYLIEQVAEHQGWGTGWNDSPDTTEEMVRQRLSLGVEITDANLAETYGPQWRAVVSLVRRAAVLTEYEALALKTARGAAWGAAWGAARGAARGAAWVAARVAAWGAAGAAAGAAAWAVVTWDLATEEGPYALEERDLLMAAWREVCGLPGGLVEG